MMASGTAIIGGGASGLFASIFLKRAGEDLLILERNPECGRKILITGHGRCNITNLKEPSELKKGYNEASKFVYPAISKFSPADCMKLFQDELGVRLKVEENDRVFPVSDRASDIRDAMVRYVGEDNIRTGFKCVSIKRENGLFEITSENGDVVTCKNLILACGGQSYPGTGSDGSGFRLAAGLGHTINKPRASLSAIPATYESLNDLQGVTVEDVALSLYFDGKKQASAGGDLLFTHNGISGPSAMKISREIPAAITGEVYILADLAEGLTDGELVGRINANPRTKLCNLISDYVPRSLASGICGDEIYCRDVRSEMRKDVLRKLRSFRFDIRKTPDISSAYCTRGGVILNELCRDSYESRLVPDLFVIGENTDVDGISGGYNLAFAAGSAFLAVKRILG